MNQSKYLILAILLITPLSTHAEGRFFYEGDGKVSLFVKKSGRQGLVRYRLGDGTYPEEAFRKINQFFGVPTAANEEVSLRLIALLDHLEDHFQAGRVEIVSGFRSREHNRRLRKRGRPAGSVSLHLDGMAVDVELKGVSARQAWDYLRGLNCCGAGYYHGGSIHVDVGPARFWDEKSSGVEKGPAPPNKLVILRTDRDVYRPGDTVKLKLARVSQYPIGVRSEMKVVKTDKKIRTVSLENTKGTCNIISGPRYRTLTLKIPQDLRSRGRVSIELTFCDSKFPEMPKKIRSNGIEISVNK